MTVVDHEKGVYRLCPLDLHEFGFFVSARQSPDYIKLRGFRNIPAILQRYGN